MTSSISVRARKAAEEQRKKDRKVDELITRQIMQGSAGRRWMWLLLSEAQIFVQSGDLDFGYMAFEKGKRWMALRLLGDVNKFTPAEYILMVKENTGVNVAPETDEEEEENG